MIRFQLETLMPNYRKLRMYEKIDILQFEVYIIHKLLNDNMNIKLLSKNELEVQFELYNDNNTIFSKIKLKDDIQYVEGEKNQVGIQIHSGLYHVVRRIFEKYGYTVEKHDRVYFSGLTKRDLPRGRWRFLSQKEVTMLKRGAFA